MTTAEIKSPDMAAKDFRLAILPLGATEQHSTHLPLAADSIISEQIARTVATRLNAFCLPLLPYSISQMHRGTPGTIWLRNQTLWHVLRDIAASVYESGFSQFLILNAHGGNQLLPAVIQDLNIEFPNLLSFSLNTYDGLSGSNVFVRDGGLCHGDEFETSLIWYLRPDLIDPSLFADNPDSIPADALRYDSFPKVSQTMHTGRPTLACAEKGKEIHDFMIRHVIRSTEATLQTVADRRERNRK